MIGIAILLLTQITVPVFLLWIGQGYRSHSAATQRLFWGGIVGYLISVAVVVTLLIVPPVFWGTNGGLRWLGIQWTPLVLPVATASAAAFSVREGRSREF